MWGLPTVALLAVMGLYFTFKTRLFTYKSVKRTIKNILGSLKKEKSIGISPFAAVATALGGTVGIGSIVGVGYGIQVGGAGSVFWMWVCSFFGMGLKYAEVKTASSRIGGNKPGGAHIRLNGLGYRKLALVFCVLCICASFGTGNLTQTGAITSFLTENGISGIASAAVCATVIAFATFGGRQRIASINSYLIPSASAVYLILCAAVLFLNRAGIANAFSSIFREAFGFSAVTGGFSGALIAHTLKEGFARSIFSNEAGMGSSPLAHASAESDDPEVQSSWGIFEIFFDTFVISTLTALCLLSGGYSDPSYMFGLCFGGIGKWIFGALLAVFAFASVISWCYYAECCISFVSPKRKTLLYAYRVFFSLCAFLGIAVTGNAVWEISDILNALMMCPNLFLLFKCRKEIGRIAN